MKWSRYNHFFKSEKHGWLLYNSGSNAFLQVADKDAPIIKAVSENAEGFNFDSNPGLYFQLRQFGCLVKEGDDDGLYNVLKMRRTTQNFHTNTLMMTVAITRACNFACSYCYESNRTGQPMSIEVADKLVNFIKAFNLDNLAITWYGGEPLLAFDRIRYIDDKIKKLERPYSAFLVTNAYLLDEKVIPYLNDLNIDTIQVTLDGSKKTHDSRRYRIGKKPTFDHILDNLEKLMESNYKGRVHVRVNVDKRNEDEYIEVHNLIKERYKKYFPYKIHVYPGFVKGEGHPDVACFYDSNDTGAFLARMAKKHGIRALDIFPRRTPAGCTLTKRNAYVVGPDGELYKCWDDVGIPELVVGHIDSITNWNMPLIAEGMVGCSYLDDPECKECFYFPVCNGGCHKMRQRNLHDDQHRDVCSYFKYHLEELLELHFEQKQESLKEQEKAIAKQKEEQEKDPEGFEKKKKEAIDRNKLFAAKQKVANLQYAAKWEGKRAKHAKEKAKRLRDRLAEARQEVKAEKERQKEEKMALKGKEGRTNA